MISFNLLIFIQFLIAIKSFNLVGCSEKEDVTITEDLRRFLGTLEKYESAQNEIVFLLDESGSITAAKYPEVKTFAELVARRFAVSAEKSRVAVVPFSDYPRIKINYIEDSVGNNMCTLIAKIHNLDYRGQGTATRLAMEKSSEIFKQARQNTTKIIVLITDGHSDSNSNPVYEAQRLKRDGVVIFAVGVADVNTKEIDAVASSKDHTYILKNFDYIKKINEKLIAAIKDISWDYVNDLSLCNNFCDEKSDCCDDNAKCYCGTMGGSYECNCAAGYYGTGHKKECHECPKGTYKMAVGNSNNCTACPPFSTTIGIGSTKSDECICEKGYKWFGNYCKAMECAKMEPPEGGILIPTICDNVYGTECKVKCKEGFCPYSCNSPSHLSFHQLPLQSRTCLDTGKWSGNDFVCEIMRCSALEHPYSGKHNCSSSNFTYGTVCQFECNEGYELIGSYTRTCLSNGTWSGLPTQCSIKYCEPLHINQNLKVKPKKCSFAKLTFNSVCIYHCNAGYTLVSQKGKIDGINVCLANQTWSKAHEKIHCKDITPPVIECPKSIKAETDPSKSTANVSWKEPSATDNIFVVSLDIIEPKYIQKPPYFFPISTTKVVYEAMDSVNLTNTCSFNVTVIDKEPPSVIFCPSDIEVFSESNDELIVTWKEPMFQDNSGKILLTPPNKKSGTGFAWGSSDVIFYNVTDPSGNKASCHFTVTVKPYPCPLFKPPVNGMVTCDKWHPGRLCSVFCNVGYDFASKEKVPTIFECSQSSSSATKMGKWIPFQLLGITYSLPLPDCSKKQKRSALNASFSLSFNVTACSEEALQQVQKKFIQGLKPFDDMIPGLICPGVDSCRPENVRVTCSSDHSRRKRSLPRTTGNSLKISFNVKLQPSTEFDIHDLENVVTDDTVSVILDELKAVASEKVREFYGVNQEPQMTYILEAICTAGQLRINDTCMNCPAGTYKDDISDSCMDCPSSTYQDKESSFSCLPCPSGYTTYQTRSKYFSDCKAPCTPGYYSKTSFEPCFPCPLHTYQELPRRQECSKCPHGLQTWKIGSNSSSDCTTPCQPGSYSDTGYEPCIPCDFGFYQDGIQQKLCSICPNGTSTRNKGSNSVENCKEINICEELNPCANSSTCITKGNDYVCVCSHGYSGRNCEERNDYCEEDYCLNNGTCQVVPEGYKCFCLHGFSGKQCEINIDDCQPDLCKNGGKCKDLIGGYECICPEGFEGLNCEINIFDCALNPCVNGGTCFDKLKGYKCCCPPGVTGAHCETKILVNLCDSIHCLNGGTCLSNETSFNCLCKTGYEGELCESQVDACLNHTCYHEGICINGIGGAICQCPLLFAGYKCEKALLEEFSLSFTSPSTANYVMIENTKRLNSITVSFFMRTSYQEALKRPTPFSYSYYDEQRNILIDNALTFYDTHRLIIYLHGEILHTGISANKDYNWHHYALVWEKKNGKWVFFVDGNIAKSGSDIGKDNYIWPGVFVLGQEQDSLGGTFSTQEAFVGDITEFNVWDYALSEKEIKLIFSSCGHIGNLIYWPQFSKDINGKIQVTEDVDLCTKNGHCFDEHCNCLYSLKDNRYCKHLVEDCSFNPCQNNQSCVKDDFHSYCKCNLGYAGKLCEYDLDECLDNNGNCSHHCINTDGSYVCSCPENMILADDNHTCKDTSFCELNGVIYLDGQSWISSCQECLCEKSRVTCSDLLCPDNNCQPEETLIHFPGECCPKCMLYSFCFVSPNNTVTNFGLSQLQLTNECSYTLLEDCHHGHFSVRREGNDTKIYQSCSIFHINSSGEMSLNNADVTSSFRNEMFDVKSNNGSVQILSHSGVYLEWYLNGEMLLALPPNLAKHACGVCGNLQKYNVLKSSGVSETNSVRYIFDVVNSLVLLQHTQEQKCSFKYKKQLQTYVYFNEIDVLH